jgi:hypothetical protein
MQVRAAVMPTVTRQAVRVVAQPAQTTAAPQGQAPAPQKMPVKAKNADSSFGSDIFQSTLYSLMNIGQIVTLPAVIAGLSPGEHTDARQHRVEQRLAVPIGELERHPVADGGQGFDARGLMEKPARGARQQGARGGLDREQPSMLAHDAPIYEQDVVEVFFAPDETTRYFELEVSPRGTVFDARVESPDGNRATMHVDRGWDCEGLVAAVRLVTIADGSRAAEVSRAIDAEFRNSLAETLTETEKAFQLGFVAQTGAIVTALRIVSFVVIVIILLSVLPPVIEFWKHRRRRAVTPP